MNEIAREPTLVPNLTGMRPVERVEELTNLEGPRRLIGLADLIPDLSEQAVAMGIADRKGLVSMT